MSNSRAALILLGALGVLIVSFGVTLSVYNYDSGATTERGPSTNIVEEED